MAFPTTPVLDDFNRADEDPLANGTWSNSFGDSTGLRIISNRLKGGAAATDGSIWTPSSFGPDTEIYLTIVTIVGGSSTVVYLAYRITSPGAAFNGYELVVPACSGSSTWTLRRFSGGTPTDVTTWTQAISNGDSVGMQVIGTSHQPYYKPAAGSWGALGSPVTNAQWTGAGQIGLESAVDAPGQVYDDFGGGTFVPVLALPVAAFQ